MITRLQYITQDMEGKSHAELADEACRAGVRWVQLRLKDKTFDDWLKIALETKEVCRSHGAQLIINDNVDIALRVGAAGVHLGKNDMNPSEARKILGKGFIIGGSTNSMDDVRRLMDEGVDYVGVGPYRFTDTKEKLNPVLGLEGVAAISRECWLEGITIPLIAIGGIVAEDVPALMEAGVHGVAIASAIGKASDKNKEVLKFMNVLNTETAWNH